MAGRSVRQLEIERVEAAMATGRKAAREDLGITVPTAAPAEIRFTVYGLPLSKLRARTVRLKSGKSRTFTPEKTATWEDSVYAQALAHRPPQPLDCPVEIDTWFYLGPKPKSRKKHEMLPDRKPDWDNLVKAVTDALESIMWTNDSRITDAHVHKRYGDPPRVEVTIREVVLNEAPDAVQGRPHRSL